MGAAGDAAGAGDRAGKGPCLLMALAAGAGGNLVERPAVRVRATGGGMNRDTGFVQEDNSGRANIFPTKQQAYIKSSTSDAAARQGLGGLQGGLLLVAVVGAVALATVLGAKAPGPETLQTVSNAFEGDSLSQIAARIQSTI
eukprot:gene4764-5012_t